MIGAGKGKGRGGPPPPKCAPKSGANPGCSPTCKARIDNNPDYCKESAFCWKSCREQCSGFPAPVEKELCVKVNQDAVAPNQVKVLPPHMQTWKESQSMTGPDGIWGEDEDYKSIASTDNLKGFGELKELGSGAQGDVYKLVLNNKLENKQTVSVVVKIFKKNAEEEEFLREVRGLKDAQERTSSGKLRSTAPRLLAYNMQRKTIVAENLENSDELEKFFLDNPDLPDEKKYEIYQRLIQNVAPLQYVKYGDAIKERPSETRMWHLDLKPRNWMINRDTLRIFMIDFGTSAWEGDDYDFGTLRAFIKSIQKL